MVRTLSPQSGAAAWAHSARTHRFASHPRLVLPYTASATTDPQPRPPRLSQTPSHPSEPQHQYLGGSHGTGPGWNTLLAGHSFPPPQIDPPSFPSNPPTLPGRRKCLTAGTVLATDPRPERVGLGRHLPDNSCPFGQ